VPAALWPVGSEATISFPQLYTYLAKYQNPREADAMTKIQEELDETKIILVRILFVERFLCMLLLLIRILPHSIRPLNHVFLPVCPSVSSVSPQKTYGILF
jgi:hypothetical protein